MRCSKGCFGKYEKLIKEYKDKVLLRGKIESADTLLLTVNARAIKNIQTEVKNIWQDFVIIGGYASGQVNCTTATLTFIVESIANSLQKIQDIVNNAYFRTWQFIQVRTCYWKSALYRSKTIKQIATDAIEKMDGEWEYNRLLNSKKNEKSYLFPIIPFAYYRYEGNKLRV